MKKKKNVTDGLKYLEHFLTSDYFVLREKKHQCIKNNIT